MTVVATSIAVEPTITAAQDNAIWAAAAALLRAEIDAVPGSGPVRGVCVIDDVLYAFRDNVGATKQEVWKATASGWSAIDYPSAYLVGFTSGNGSFDGVGAIGITQGANTATIHRTMLQSGTFAGGDAKGVFLLRAASSPGSLTSGAATLQSGLGTVTLVTGTTVPYQAVSLRPGGKWKFQPYQFAEGGLSSSIIPVYGVDWIDDSNGGNFIEFDGDIVCPIQTSDFPTLYPERMACHKNHVFIAIGGSLWFSGIGNPYSYTVLSGGGEIVIGDSTTELQSIQGSEDQGALLVCCENKTQVVYGNDSTDWNMVPLSSQVGAKAHSMQQIAGQTLAFDQQGVRNFSPSQNFGNFSYNTLTNHIRNKVEGLTPSASVVDRKGGRYRVFFTDGSFLSGIPGKRWAWMFCRYPITVFHASEWELGGAPVIYVTDEAGDGFVYKTDIGRSFAGDDIIAWLKTAYAHLGSPGRRKAIRRCDVEIKSLTAGSIQAQADLSYGDIDANEHALATVVNGALTGSDGAFDLGAWDEGTWDAAYLTEVRVRVEGVGDNVAMLLYSAHDDEKPHDVTALTYYHLPRRQTR